MISLGHICVDGTKMKANASNYSAVTKEDFSKLKELLEKDLEEGIMVDEEETGYLNRKRNETTEKNGQAETGK